MDLRPYVAQLQQELAVAAEAGGDDARALAARLTGPLESAARLVLLDALSTAAAEISRELTDGSVDLRLRGLEPEFVVDAPRAEPAAASAPPPATTGGEDKATARFSLRLPERLKPRLEQAAERAGQSVNAWLVATVTTALDAASDDRARPSAAQRTATGGQRRSGWVR